MNTDCIHLADGRALNWETCGSAHGQPVLYCHGFPASGAEAAFTEAAAAAAGARILAPDRPGFGRSDPAPGRRLIDWVDDATALLDHLGIAAAPVIGVSGGGPYALACAARQPDRFPRVATFGALGTLARPGCTRGMAPLSRLSIHLARHWPHVQAALFHTLAHLIRLAPSLLFRLLSLGECAADRAVFRTTDLRAPWIRSLRHSVAQGGIGAIEELRLYVRPWHFDPSEVRGPVQLWHGLDDTVVPSFHGEYLAAALPQCDARFIPAEGHFSVPVRFIDEALQTLCAG